MHRQQEAMTSKCIQKLEVDKAEGIMTLQTSDHDNKLSQNPTQTKEIVDIATLKHSAFSEKQNSCNGLSGEPYKCKGFQKQLNQSSWMHGENPLNNSMKFSWAVFCSQ
ncbi:hypothetical protein AOXY_G21998 [Acipenser oxyrinchus oxyrinchus]|uniref:Uncharacterized protein n=1 Tax=Acipenser oxyrinchus oxyrinchus TaxID=40147 RepID=A0AAD8CXA5_ACIOX|nr:hypothetical protein AOXY_G21998 [Acipenser oxyrinchus oxyrinchus]